MSENDLMCQYAPCKSVIDKAMAYVRVSGSIILRQGLVQETNALKSPLIYTSFKQADNYAQTVIMHDTCWIKFLRECGVVLHDLSPKKEDA